MKKIIKEFIQGESIAGFGLIFAAIVALCLANSEWSGFYNAFLDTEFKLGFLNTSNEFIGLKKPLTLWVNDALMALFFLLVGLEIKREIIVGELASREKLLRPLFAAIGGMAGPALIYVLITASTPEARSGWAIPAATDIAFALGMLSLLGKRVPIAFKVLLTAIAILDDLGAILVIAFFYNTGIDLYFLSMAFVGMAILFLFNRLQLQRVSLYIFAGLIVWFGFLKTGIHPTLAGVLTAFAIPMEDHDHNPSTLGPLVSTEKGLHPWITYFILPIFALTNAGLDLSNVTVESFYQPVTLGIMGGLLLGKPLGIMAGFYFGHLSGLAKKPKNQTWLSYIGISMLCAIGFTMSLFIGDLAFDGAEKMAQVKLGVLSASVMAALAAQIVCRIVFPKPTSSH